LAARQLPDLAFAVVAGGSLAFAPVLLRGGGDNAKSTFVLPKHGGEAQRTK
jgi:hypothetical protein